jgi:curli production assembly/transport component CsgF
LKYIRRGVLGAWALSTALGGVATAAAGELVYRPVNPSFGGDPLNGSALLNEANAQNHHKDPAAGAASTQFGSSQSALQQFTNALQNSILARVGGAVSSQVVDSSGKLIPGIFTVGNIKVEVVNGVGALSITTTDLSSGQSTTFQVPN